MSTRRVCEIHREVSNEVTDVSNDASLRDLSLYLVGALGGRERGFLGTPNFWGVLGGV